MHHAPDVFQSLLVKYRLNYSDATFQFKPPDAQFIRDTHLALFPNPTIGTLHQVLSAWCPDKDDPSQMPTFLISIRTLFWTLPDFFKGFTPQSILNVINSLLSPSLQTALDFHRDTVTIIDDILPCLIRIQSFTSIPRSYSPIGYRSLPLCLTNLHRHITGLTNKFPPAGRPPKHIT